MPAEFKIEYIGVVPELLLDMRKAKWSWARIVKAAWFKAGCFWHSELREKHFTHAGAREYGYLPRAGETGNTRKKFWASYTGRKQRIMGHTLPLVWSGESMNLTKIRKIRTKAEGFLTYSGCEVILPSPGFNRRNPHSHINMREEVTAISQRDASTVVRGFEGEVNRRLNAIRGRKTVTIK